MITNQSSPAIPEDLLAGASLLFGLLGTLLYEEPSREDVQALVDDDVFADAPFAASNPDVIAGLEALESWSTRWQADPDAAMDQLKVDWMRLFAGAGLAPIAPWESVFVTDERALFSEDTLAVRNWYRRFGLESAKLHNEPDDHIGLELIFVAHLAGQAVAAQQAGDDVGRTRALRGLTGFCSERLFGWGPVWAQQCADTARTDFYHGLALLVKGALAELAEVLREAADRDPAAEN